jgi:hypothetical protein
MLGRRQTSRSGHLAWILPCPIGPADQGVARRFAAQAPDTSESRCRFVSRTELAETSRHGCCGRRRASPWFGKEERHRKSGHVARSSRGGVNLFRCLARAISLGMVLLSGLLLFPACFPCCTRCAKHDRALLDLRCISQGLKLFFSAHGHYPDTSEGLGAFVQDRQLEAIYGDPWGREYQYRGTMSSFWVMSLGADGVHGGEDDDEDICASSRWGPPLPGESTWVCPGVFPPGTSYPGPSGSFHRPPSLIAFSELHSRHASALALHP